jgi:putative component of toxin-antitoxin plasmid stabilization module
VLQKARAEGGILLAGGEKSTQTKDIKTALRLAQTL